MTDVSRMHYLKTNKGKIIGGIAFFVFGLILGFALNKNYNPAYYPTSIRANDKDFLYINPLLACNISENKEFAEYKPLKDLINNFVGKADPAKVQIVSLYYRDLNSGRWFSSNENELFAPASLFKVPLMIAYLKAAESDPQILSQKIFYSSSSTDLNNVEHYKSPIDIISGNYYTVDDLIKSMIYYSDNNAMGLLADKMNPKYLSEVLTDINMDLPSATGTTPASDFLTVKTYSYLFRLLYNSTYLNRQMSEKALDLLTFVDFPQGLINGVPPEIKIAQKFGERTELASGQVAWRELHDCGIVYYPDHPYLLCVMTKGQDFDTLSSVISGISSLVYSEVDKKYKK